MIKAVFVLVFVRFLSSSAFAPVKLLEARGQLRSREHISATAPDSDWSNEEVDYSADNGQVDAFLDNMYSEWDSDAPVPMEGLEDFDLMEDPDVDKKIDTLQEIAFNENSELPWKEVDSHLLVELDPDTGEPWAERFVYVDEHACVGCTHCAHVASSTFFMEDEYGRARVYRQ